MTSTFFNTKNKSKIYAFAQTIPYALVPLVWIGIDLGFKGSNLSTSIAKAVIVTLAKDFISTLVYILIISIKGKLKETLRLINSKPGFFVIIAGIFGGPIGYLMRHLCFRDHHMVMFLLLSNPLY